MVGVYAIVTRDLGFMNYIDLKDEEVVPFLVEHFDTVVAPFLCIWFLYTSIRAVLEAQKRNFVFHQHWIVRHVGSGIWVSLMRVLLGFSTPCFPFPLSDKWRALCFASGGFVSIIICFLGAEYTVHLLKEKERLGAKYRKLE